MFFFILAQRILSYHFMKVLLYSTVKLLYATIQLTLMHFRFQDRICSSMKDKRGFSPDITYSNDMDIALSFFVKNFATNSQFVLVS